MRKLFISIFALLCFTPAIASAQDPTAAQAPVAQNAEPAAAVAQDAPPTAQNEQNAEPADTNAADTQQKSNEPGDVIANYFVSMADLVAQNMDSPAALLEKFNAYISENEKSMRKASKAFEDKIQSLKGNEAEVYRETVQRKLTPALNKLISLLIDFENRYPTEAAKLNSMLKVDAKYTYQQ